MNRIQVKCGCEIGSNNAAHPNVVQSAGTIVDVDPGEAEWLLELLENLFDFDFAQPAKDAARKAQLNVKLASIGKKTI